MATTEKNLENKFINICKKYHVKTIKGDSRNNVGFPDRMVFNHHTRTIHFIEFKNETYYPHTIPQKKWQELIEQSGGTYFLINGEQEMKNYIDKYIKVEVDLDTFYQIEDNNV